MADSGRAHTKEHFPELLLPVSLSLRLATATPRLCRRPSNTSRLVWFSLLWGHFSLPLGPDVHTTLCVPSKSGVSVSPRPFEDLQSISASLQSLILWEFRPPPPFCQTPRLGSLLWGSGPSLQSVDFCGIIFLQFVSHPPSGYGIWFHCDCAPPTISLRLLLCLWMWGIFFHESQCLPVNDCSAVNCDSGALARGSKRMSFYSTILNQSHLLMHSLNRKNKLRCGNTVVAL